MRLLRAGLSHDGGVTFDLAAIGAGLPVADLLPALDAALDAGGRAVVQAPPGTGKTTLVPPAVANRLAAAAMAAPGEQAPTRELRRVIVTQPRRIAARAAARRLAQLSGTRLGAQVGFTVRGDQRTSAATQVEFVTTGVLLRRLLGDPDLSGVGAVVLDEVHERHLDADLAFAMVKEVAELRGDLAVVVMSATIDADRWAALLGDSPDPVPVMRAESVLHPLQITWAPAPPGVARTDVRGVTFGFLDHVAAVTASAFADATGNALVFLPGAWEVEQVVSRLLDRGVQAVPLSGRLSPSQQDAALADSGPRKVIVSTAVAESSLTVPGVRLVVDAGLSREPRYDSVRGMAGLVTVSEARSSAEQRAGRAARLGPGRVLRCFPESDWPRLREAVTPEILTTDLTEAALVMACWGAPRGAGLALPDPPPALAIQAAERTLRGLGAVDDDGVVTERGRDLATVPTDPRLARALLAGAAQLGAERAGQIVAMLALDERPPGGDLVALWRALRQGTSPSSRRWLQEADRLGRLAGGGRPPIRPATGSPLAAVARDDAALGIIVALAYPDRIAHEREPGGRSFLLASGTGALVDAHSPLRGCEWLAVAQVDRGHTADGSGAVIRAAVPISEALALEAGADLIHDDNSATWADGRVSARRTTSLGAIELTSTPVRPTAGQARAAVLEALRRDGLGLFEWSPAAETLRRRLGLLHRTLGAPWPAIDDATLLERADEWLGPELDALARGKSPAGLSLTVALKRLLPWPQAGRLDELVPERLEVPTGSLIRVDYPPVDDPDARPVLAVKLQECLGWTATPRLCDGRVPVLLHLLSPARRPLAVTDDLASFWANAYPQVRAENRGRYAKHPWPLDPLTAEPRRGTSRSGRAT